MTAEDQSCREVGFVSGLGRRDTTHRQVLDVEGNGKVMFEMAKNGARLRQATGHSSAL
jgi:hypothetical protein